MRLHLSRRRRSLTGSWHGGRALVLSRPCAILETGDAGDTGDIRKLRRRAIWEEVMRIRSLRRLLRIVGLRRIRGRVLREVRRRFV